jgi:hypothetical protein
MKKLVLLLWLFLVTYGGLAQTRKALFDNTKVETAGNADWIIDTDQPVPVPAQSGITSSTAESYWLGAISAWGVDLVKLGFTVHTLTSSYGITYGNSSNPYDLSNYNLFIVCEPQGPFSAAEKLAIKNFVQNGGGLMMVADHNSSDRNSDGWDSPKVWNDLRTDSLFGIHFQSASESNNSFSEVSTNVATGNDPLIVGQYGTVTALSYHSGTSMTVLPAVNPNATGRIWMNGATHGTSQIMFATSKYGQGKVAGVGDSSPADDGSAQPGNSSIYDGWKEVGATDNIVFLNACLWLIAPDSVGQVTLVSPANAATGVTIPVTFRWNTAANATNYQFDLSLSSSFSTIVVTDSTLTDTTKTVSGLISDTVYYWRVRAKNGTGWGSYSTARNFRTGATVYIITSSAGANGTIAPSGSVNVTSGANQSFTISPATGYHIDSVLVDGANQGAVSGYTFTNVTANHTIRAIFRINQYQMTSSAGTNGSISPFGITTVNYGANQTYNLSPSTGYHVDSLIVDDVLQPSAVNYTFTNVTANHSIRVTFLINLYTITASAGANGSIDPSGTATVIYGGSQSFNFTPATGYHVDSLIVDGANQPAAASYTFTNVGADHTIRVTFAPNTYTLTVNATGGTVTQQPDLSLYAYGQSVQLTPVPSQDYAFSHWSGDVLSGHESDVPLSLTIDSNTTITATFRAGAFTLTITALNGSVLRNPDQASYDSGSTVQLTAIPSGGYHFDGWTGDVTGATNPLSLLMDAPKSLTAHFLSDSSFITTSAGEHGTIDPQGIISILNGGTQRFIIQPEAGYRTDSVLVDESPVADSLNGYTFENVVANHTIRVTFASVIASVPAHQSRGWNLVSLPVLVSDPRLQTMFPTASSQSFGYSGQYLQSDSLFPGIGYWIKFAADRETTLAGLAIATDSIPVQAGWNMIGTISTPVEVASITSDPPNIVTGKFFGYEHGYIPTDTLHPAKGYWVKTGEDGILILAANVSKFPGVAKSSRIKISVTSEMPPPPPREAVLTQSQTPNAYALGWAYPNPFNPSTTIEYALPEDSRVSLRVYNVIGQEIATLANEIQQAGYVRCVWNASSVTSGVYFYRLEATSVNNPASTFNQVRKIVLMK